ncbi:MAG: hypothetical protein U0271_47025 [Polyangiaceae bacterium]
MKARLVVLCSSLVACSGAKPEGGGGATDLQPPAQTANASAAGDFEVHEWGVLEVYNGAATLLAGPGAMQRLVPVKKPVLYFHSNGAALSNISVRVTIPTAVSKKEVALRAGVMEHAPAGELSADGTTLLWSGLRLKDGACQNALFAPAKTEKDLPSCGTPDGICEVNELGRYVANDADCLVDRQGSEAPFLFYRATESPPPLPFDVESRPLAAGGTELRLIHARGTDFVGPLIRVRTDGVTAKAAILDTPAMGQSVLTYGGDADRALDEKNLGKAHTALLDSMSRDFGLTTGEIQAFDRAWASTLFPNPAVVKTELPSKAALAAQDFVFFALPPSMVAAVAGLEISPLPRTLRRFLLVRMAL